MNTKYINTVQCLLQHHLTKSLAKKHVTKEASTTRKQAMIGNTNLHISNKHKHDATLKTIKSSLCHI